MPLNAGDLTMRIAIQAPPAARDADYGDKEGAWTTIAKVWAQPVPDKARQTLAAAQLQVELAFGWRIRFRDDIPKGARVARLDEDDEVTAEVYELVGLPAPSADRTSVDLYCTRGTGDGR